MTLTRWDMGNGRIISVHANGHRTEVRTPDRIVQLPALRFVQSARAREIVANAMARFGDDLRIDAPSEEVDEVLAVCQAAR